MMDDSGLLNPPEPRRLTPEAIRGWTFPRVMRGADMPSVEEFRDAVMAELCLLWDENRELVAEVGRLSQQLPAPAAAPVPAPAAAQAAPTAPSPIGGRAAHVLLAAQSQGEQILDEARNKASDLVQSAEEHATREAAKILAAAPVDAEARVAQMMATGDAIEEELTAMLDSLAGILGTWREAVMGPGGGQPNGAHAAPG